MYQGKFANHQKGRSTADLLKERMAQENNQPPVEEDPSLNPAPEAPAVPVSPDFDEPVPPMFEKRPQAPVRPQPPVRPQAQRPAPPQSPGRRQPP